MNLFDYIFYRVHRFYQKRDGTPAIYASAVLTIMQFFFLLSILALTRLIIDFPIPQKYFVIPIILLLLGVNWYRYEREFDIRQLESKWGQEDSALRKRRGLLLVVSLISFILFPILIGVLKHNLGAI